jgi:hypothetical protein
METPQWRRVSQAQCGLLARRTLEELDVSRPFLRAQIAADRWQRLSPTVIATFTGTPTREQQMWCGVLHAGPRSMIAGLTATELAGLQRWHRDVITVLVPDGAITPRPLEGFEFRRTSRNLRGVRASPWGLPRTQPVPAALLWAATQSSERTAVGLIHALVQQRLAEPSDISSWMERLGRLRHARALVAAIAAMSDGIQSVAEQDLARLCRRFHLAPPRRQVARRDSQGRRRFTDAEWSLPDGRTIILEVDGGFHMDTDHWEDDIARQRGLAHHGAIMIRCTARELRDSQQQLAADLIRLGVPGLVGRKRSS